MKFKLFILLSLTIHVQTFCQVNLNKYKTDSTLINYYDGTLEFVHYNNRQESIYAFDKKHSKLLRYSLDGEETKLVQFEKDGPNGYGAYIENISFLESGGLFLITNKFFINFDENWRETNRQKNNSNKPISPLTLIQTNVSPSYTSKEKESSIFYADNNLPYSKLEKSQLDTLKALKMINSYNLRSKNIIPLLSLGYDNDEYYTADFKKPIYSVSNKKLFISFPYSDKIYILDIEDNYRILQEIIIRKPVTEALIDFKWPVSKKTMKIREATLKVKPITKLIPLRDFVLVEFLTVNQSGQAQIDFNDSESISKFMSKGGNSYTKSYKIFSSENSSRVDLEIEGDILFSSENVLFLLKPGDVYGEEFYTIYKINLSQFKIN